MNGNYICPMRLLRGLFERPAVESGGSGNLRDLLRLRLKWYTQATGRLLLRRWQVIALASGILAPLGSALLDMAAVPVLVLLDPTSGGGLQLLVLILWQVFWALWALMQGEQIRGGAFAHYLQSLPVSPGTWRRIDLVILLIADTPLLIQQLSAAAILVSRPHTEGALLQGGLLLMYLLCSQLSAQQVALIGKVRVMSTFMLMNLLVVLVLALPPVYSAVALVLPVAASLYALSCGVPVLPMRWHLVARSVVQPLQPANFAARQRLPANVQTSLGIVYRQHLSALLGKVLLCTLITLASLVLMRVWRFDVRCLPLALITSALISLNVSGLYRFLYQAHESAASFIVALPLERRWWRLGDIVAVLSFGLPFALVLGAVLWFQVGVPTPTILGYLASFALMLSLLRGLVLYSARHAVVLSSVFASLWTAATLTILQS